MVRELFTKIYTRINWRNRSEALTTPLGKTLLNRMDYALDETDSRIVALDVLKAEESEVLQMVKEWSMDEETGIITVTKKNGEKIMFDLNIEKIPVSFTLSPQGILTMTTDDGTKFTADIGSMIPVLTFKASDTVSVTVEGTGINKTYSFSVKEGSIKDKHLQPSYLADIKLQAQAADKSAGTAQTEADRAKTEADRAKSEADRAKQTADNMGTFNVTAEDIGAVKKEGDTMTGTLASSKTTGSYLAGNQGQAIINSTAGAGAYTMLDKLNSSNGYFTDGVYQGKRIFNYTAKSTADAKTNAVTKSVTLLDEAGNSSFPGTVSAQGFSGNATSATKLATKRSINGIQFDGSSDITDYIVHSGNVSGTYNNIINLTLNNFTIKDGSTLRIRFNKSLPPDMDYAISINNGTAYKISSYGHNGEQQDLYFNKNTVYTFIYNETKQIWMGIDASFLDGSLLYHVEGESTSAATTIILSSSNKLHKPITFFIIGCGAATSVTNGTHGAWKASLYNVEYYVNNGDSAYKVNDIVLGSLGDTTRFSLGVNAIGQLYVTIPKGNRAVVNIFLLHHAIYSNGLS